MTGGGPATVTSPPAESPRVAPSATPSVRRWLRRRAGWIAGIVALLVVAILWTASAAGIRDGTPFAPDNPGPTGAMALAEVLRARGVDVVAADSRAAVAGVGSVPADTTLLLDDAGLVLDREAIASLAGVADRIVLVEPSGEALAALAAGVAFAGFPDADGPVPPRCDLPAAERSGAVTTGDASVRAGKGGEGTVFCYPTGGGAFLLARTSASGPAVTVLPDATPFDNDHIAAAGNAALALNVLGEARTLIWYQPGLLDLTGVDEAPTVADLTPEWVTPVLVLLVVVFLAAAVWRGRRFGPLVVENLPVVVPAGETVEGRARLYQRSGARRRALDALRVGAVGRLATTLGLSRTATVDDVAYAAARTLARPVDEVRALLLDAEPAGDADLVRLAAALQELERDLRAAADPATPGRMDR